MKANEFVKKFGWGAAKNILHWMDDASEFSAHMTGDTWDKPTLIDAVGLRRLIESHELVSKATPEELYQAEICEGIWCNHRLKQAIEDVESCQ